MAAQDIRRHFASEYNGIYVDPPTDGSPFYIVRAAAGALLTLPLRQSYLHQNPSGKTLQNTAI